MKILLFLHTFFDILRFGGTLGKIGKHTCASRHIGRETLDTAILPNYSVLHKSYHEVKVQ